MQVKLTKAAIAAYAEDLRAQGNQAEAAALTQLVGAFNGMLSKPFSEFIKITKALDLPNSPSSRPEDVCIIHALPALERLQTLMSVVSSSDRRKDLQLLIKFLRSHESARIKTFLDAVQRARRGPPKRPTMSLDELKAQLDPSLGDDSRFKPILAQLKLLNEADFADVAGSVLQVPFKSKKEGLARLSKLHTITRTNRMKETAATKRPAA